MQLKIEISKINNKLGLMKFAREFLKSSLEDAKILANKELPIIIEMWWHNSNDIKNVLNNIVEYQLFVLTDYIDEKNVYVEYKLFIAKNSSDYIDEEEINRQNSEAIEWYNSLSHEDKRKVDRLILCWGGR